MNHKYYIIQSSNGTVSIVSEWDDLNAAIVAYHDRCKILWNASDVIEGIVQLIYSADLAVVGGHSERISHAQPEPKQEPKPEPEPEDDEENSYESSLFS